MYNFLSVYMLTLLHFGTDEITDAVILLSLLTNKFMVNINTEPVWYFSATVILKKLFTL